MRARRGGGRDAKRTSRGANRGVARALAMVLPLLVLLAACQGSSHRSGAAGSHPSDAAASSAKPVPPARLTVVPADDSAAVVTSTPVTVTADDGKLTTVSVKDAAGSVVSGAIDSVADRWVSSGILLPGSTYLVTATAVDAKGEPTTVTSNFTTAAPAKVLGAKIAPLENELVGVGMPIIIYFTSPVTDRAAVESRLSLDESQPVVGAWHWYGDEEIHYRPENYWPTGEKVTLHANLNGVNAGNGVWGVEDHTVDFSVGDSHITTVNALTHEMTVQVNGKTVKTAPVSLGSNKYPTTSGIHVVLNKTPSIVMNSATVGIPKGNPDYYDETVQWDVRITWSGEFVHSAPWSVSSQGRVNVSHGCVNASPTVAQWFFNLSMRGDIVSITGTPRSLVSQNGWTDWNMSWAQWVAGSALGTSNTGTLSSAAGGSGAAKPLPADPGSSLPASQTVTAPAPIATHASTTPSPNPTHTVTPSPKPTHSSVVVPSPIRSSGTPIPRPTSTIKPVV